MKILFLNYEYPPLGGGAGNATKCILEEYSKNLELDIDLVTSSIDRADHVESVGQNVRIHRLDIGKNPAKMRYQSQWELLKYSWRAYFYSRALLKKNEYDVIHAFFGIPCGFVAMMLSRSRNIPYVVSLRGADVPGYSERFSLFYYFLKPLIIRVWRGADCVISNSKGLLDLAKKSDSTIDIGLIYNGVDTTTFLPRSDSLESTDRVTILCASRLSRRKGFKYAVEAFSLLSSKYPNLRLLVAGGEGNAEKELKNMVASMHLEKGITFCGEYDREKLIELQKESDIFVFPSFNEGMSNSMLEAMASGLPIVMTPTGGAEELIHDGENGFLVGFGNARDIAEKIETLLQNPQLRKKMALKSRLVAETMSWETVSQQYVNVYRSVTRSSKIISER